MADGLRKRKIVILGACSVGKSSLFDRFIDDKFETSYFPTIENHKKKTIKFNGVDYECELVDTAGKEEYCLINDRDVLGIHGYIFVYSTASRNSFENVQILYNKILDAWGKETVPCVFVGSKADLEAWSHSSQEITPEMFAKEKCAAWVETSAKGNINIEKVFELCLAEIAKSTPGMVEPSPERSKCRIM